LAVSREQVGIAIQTVEVLPGGRAVYLQVEVAAKEETVGEVACLVAVEAQAESTPEVLVAWVEPSSNGLPHKEQI
jgi:hypothetical protein